MDWSANALRRNAQAPSQSSWSSSTMRRPQCAVPLLIAQPPASQSTIIRVCRLEFVPRQMVTTPFAIVEKRYRRFVSVVVISLGSAGAVI